jgi:hypothetical protein
MLSKFIKNFVSSAKQTKKDIDNKIDQLFNKNDDKKNVKPKKG